ncbi:MAG: molybdopterin-dependent oxidoreductase [Peptococcaceae bacterium]|nr:molybdopterin-dependent oxidoreductase [Peptococcaceae bacterium]
MTTVRSVCPLNCPDCCSFLVEVLGDRINVHGDMQAMGVNGFICSRGRGLGDMVFSQDRLQFPMLKKNGNWQKISWEEAYDILTGKIKQTIDEFGSKAILHMFDNGHNGMLRKLDRRFFQALGGVTEPRGSMCWGAGIEAQEKDFGAVYSSDWEELLHSKTIVLWGRDPAVTNKHLIPLLRQASAQGAHIIVINPLRVKSAVFADEYIRVNPGTDGILALGISHVILRERWMDFDFVRDYAANFGAYAPLIKEYPPERASEITGVPTKTIEELARRISQDRPVMFYLGYGLQRYVNGGNTVRAIDALGIISGNIGCPGGGVFYAHQYHRENLNTVLLPEDTYNSRTFPHATIARELLQEDIEPKIQLAFVTRTNTLVTEPDSERWQELWNRIPFKVTLDVRMSQTASMSDLVLPVTTIFEEEDIVASSWSNKIHYAQKALDPQGDVKPEPIIFTELAQRMGIGDYFTYTPKEWISYIIEPLHKQGITLDELKESPVRAPYIPKIAWEDKKFCTPSGKAELLTKQEFTYFENESPVESYFKSLAQQNDKENDNVFYLEDYKTEKKRPGKNILENIYIFMTPHPDLALHTQFQESEGFQVIIHPRTAAKYNIGQGDQVAVENESGRLIATAYISEDIHEQMIVVPEGTTENNLGVNRLIPGRLSSIGENTAYYDTFCTIRKWQND